MTRPAAWSSCNRVLEEKWHESQLQAHRERLEFIQTASSVSAEAFSSALAASAHPHRIHSGRVDWSSSSPVKIVARSKSPAAKSRQKQIDRDNLVLIKKIIALDNAKNTTTTGTTAASKPRRGKGTSKKHYSRATGASTARNTVVVPQLAHTNHECLHPLPEVPHSATSHALYTRDSATMKNNFAEMNTPTMAHASNSMSAAERIRSRKQTKIFEENKKMLHRILTARTAVGSRSAWLQHEKEHNKIRSIISRHHSTSRLQQQQQHRGMHSSRSQGSLQRASDNELGFKTAPRDSYSPFIRLDPTSHLTPQHKRRPLSASHTRRTVETAAAEAAVEACPLPLHTSRRRSSGSESVVTRIRRMTIEQHDDEDGTACVLSERS